jgi:hypothetical protein
MTDGAFVASVNAELRFKTRVSDVSRENHRWRPTFRRSTSITKIQFNKAFVNLDSGPQLQGFWLPTSSCLEMLVSSSSDDCFCVQTPPL